MGLCVRCVLIGLAKLHCGATPPSGMVLFTLENLHIFYEKHDFDSFCKEDGITDVG